MHIILYLLHSYLLKYKDCISYLTLGNAGLEIHGNPAKKLKFEGISDLREYGGLFTWDGNDGGWMFNLCNTISDWRMVNVQSM